MKKVKGKLGASIVIVVALLLLGYSPHNLAVSSSGAPFYLAYDSEEIIWDQSKVATITSTNSLKEGTYRQEKYHA